MNAPLPLKRVFDIMSGRGKTIAEVYIDFYLHNDLRSMFIENFFDSPFYLFQQNRNLFIIWLIWTKHPFLSS